MLRGAASPGPEQAAAGCAAGPFLRVPFNGGCLTHLFPKGKLAQALGQRLCAGAVRRMPLVTALLLSQPALRLGRAHPRAGQAELGWATPGRGKAGLGSPSGRAGLTPGQGKAGLG